MQLWVVFCWAVLALVGAHECPDGRRCEEGQTCCNDPASGYKCCPFHQAECCEDHIHCCPAATVCDVATSSCLNATVSMPWVERTSYSDPRLSKSFRMIKTYVGEDEDNICPDLSRCPPEFSCLRALTKFGCCPLANGSPCSDGKHCCPEDHECSGDSRSCIKKELVTAVPCSDGKIECPQGTTCCETPEGEWGCCPMPKAVCCEDKLHCCPEGTACDVKQSKCISLSTKTAMPMWDKLPARIRAEWENQKGEHMTAEAAVNSGSERTQDTTANTVPPSQEEVSVSSVTKAAGSSDVPCSDTVGCPDNHTCCRSQSLGWSCCPLPKAVCCNDHKHCCPKGKKCNLAEKTCEDDTSSVPLVKKVPAIPRQNVEARNVPCNSTVGCPDGTTCCKTKDGGWACCPYPEAVCCDDFLHCCPKGKQCNLAASTCDGETGASPWAKKLPAIPRQNVEARNVPCNSTVGCPDGTTCCKTKDGGWACCPYPEAVCCDDFLHCCPKGKQCNLAASTCDGETGASPWAEKLPAIPRQNVEARNVPCNSTVGCPDGTTCCKTKDGGWACCPYPEAVCCDDFLHCCPKGKQCNLAASTCDGETGASPWAEKLPAIPRQNVEARNVPCNSTVGCPDGTTCCKTKDGGWACCPYPEAVCCDDFLHCCPKGKQCNLAASTCDGETGASPWAEKLPAIPRQNVEARNVPCNSTVGCPDGTTCCKTKDGGWACCPYPEAVCCDDFLHCCPKGKQCNLAASTCDGETGASPWAKKLPAIPRQNVEARNVPCNSTVGCPDGTTCCKTKDGGWACCPYPEAVCCDDFLHCCPKGKQCNLAASTCDGETGASPWAKKLPAIPRQNVEARNVPCNSTVGCPDGTTCCKTKDGGWACCPYPEAVCCDDFLHCCPKGKQCNLAASTCDGETGASPWAEKLPAIPRQNVEARNVPCNSTVGCPDGTTCCKTKDGGWACCPYPEAVCCDDFLHCCPKGKQCNLAASTCDGETGASPWAEKLPAIPRQNVEARNVPCNSTVGCPDGTTCCKTKDGGWACCPYPEAVCCDDFLHCCPKGKQCNLAASTCDGETGASPWAEKLPAIPRQNVEARNVPCNSTVGCPDGTTCCKTKDGGWACCPYPEAVCCDDFLHCCPKGKQCNLAASTCDGETGASPWAKKLPAIPRQNVEARNVPCNSTVGCPDGTTCCKTKDGGWACCPYPEAVCCDDFLHCCPKGKQCNLAASTCDGETGASPWAKKLPAIPRQNVEARNVPCNSTVGCPDGTTCCKTKDGGWACCPYPEAVCCDDFLHCCPKGKQCNLAASTCDGETGASPWAEKLPAIPRQNVEARNVPCNSTVGCPDGTTCCKTKDGGWACCPYPEAVCCDDFLHCCPKGKQCNLAASTCDGETGASPWAEKLPAIPRQNVEARNVPCNSTVGCPDGTTCCKTKDGGWACCPYPEAVCCDDFLHCCPKGKQCNLAASTCDGETGASPWAEKLPAIPRQNVEARNVPCNSTVGCPDGTTCCKTKAGDWACCPLPKAVCCDDHEHCCPSGTTCDLTTVTCHNASGSTPMTLKTPAFTTVAPTTVALSTETQETGIASAEDKKWKDEDEEENRGAQNRVQCDAHTSCPQYTTCCFMASTHKWGCCPLPQAVCCTDGSHCCPKQYKCDEHKTSCIKGEVVIPWYTKLQATTSADAPSGSEQCDGLNQCPKDTTCCRLKSGEWGCCPMQNAVCCPDQEHCCPQGYTCNMASKSCQKLHVETLLLTPVLPPKHQHQPSPVKSKNVPCDDKTSCKDGQTCCRTSATTWGCCPAPNAVCCSDMKHCCEAGYTCTDTGDCIKDTMFNWFNWHMFRANEKRALVV